MTLFSEKELDPAPKVVNISLDERNLIFEQKTSLNYCTLFQDTFVDRTSLQQTLDFYNTPTVQRPPAWPLSILHLCSTTFYCYSARSSNLSDKFTEFMANPIGD